MNIFDNLVTPGGIHTLGGKPSFSRIVGFDGTFSSNRIGPCQRIDPCSHARAFRGINALPSIGPFRCVFLFGLAGPFDLMSECGRIVGSDGP
jgi:hypothetical protein